MPIDLYLARHASPDATRTDIVYDVVPGPPLSPHGEREAQALAAFLVAARVRHVRASPFERAHHTARIVADALQLEVELEHAIGEWHVAERARDVVARIEPVLARCCTESLARGPLCLVSHGGPIGVMLRKLGMDRAEVDAHRGRYGGTTPVPMAGVWRAWGESPESLRFDLVFAPRDVATR